MADRRVIDDEARKHEEEINAEVAEVADRKYGRRQPTRKIAGHQCRVMQHDHDGGDAAPDLQGLNYPVLLHAAHFSERSALRTAHRPIAQTQPAATTAPTPLAIRSPT